MAVRINVHKNTNSKSLAFGKWYGYVDNDAPIGIADLAAHMSEHNTPFSPGTIAGVLTDMVHCIRELNLNSVPVKLDNLCIFKASVETNGINDLAEFTIAKGIKRIRLSAQATGDYTADELTKAGSLELSKLAKQMIDEAKEHEG
ncbi:MAG: DNA-binding protein [Prevotella sp.]|nr:DNA-binding protein [Prevotella sp.]